MTTRGAKDRDPTALRVVLGSETSGPGGAEAMVLQLAEGLRAYGVDVRLATMRAGWMTERAERAGFPVRIDAMRDGPDPAWVMRFRRWLRAERIDLVHTHEFEMNAYGGLAARLAAIPSVATVHGNVAGTDPKHLFAYRVLRRLGQRPVAVSHDLLRQLAPRLGADAPRWRVIHNGTTVPATFDAETRARDRAAARAEIGLAQAPILVVAIGNLYPVKDHASLLRALADAPDVHVAIAGRGAEEEPLRALAARLGMGERAHLLGLRDDVPRILAAADVFTQPSLSEGLPLAVLEAMASGTAVVASDVGGIGEAVVDGVSGRLVPPADPAVLGRTLLEIARDAARRDALAEAGWQRARDAFSTEAMTRAYLALYGERLGGRVPHAARIAEASP